jgi:hypothetical protein
LGIVGLVCAACTPSQPAAPPPTLTLIAATATHTPTPVTPTVTPQNLPGPSDLVTPRSQDGSVSTSTPANTLETLLQSDPIAADLASLALRRIADQLDVPPFRVRIIEVTPYEWLDSSLGCPLPGQTYAEVDVIGYRIVLFAGGNQYIFHSDTEQLVACDEENEVLPE